MRDIGSCVLLKIKNRIFVVTAAHVLDLAKDAPLMELILKGQGLIALISGINFRRVDDIEVDGERVAIDAAVFELVGSISKIFLERAFDEEMLSEPTFTEWHMVGGYPYNYAKRTKKTLELNPIVFSSSLHSPMYVKNQFIKYRIEEESLVNVSYGFVHDGMKIENGVINKMMSLKGMSGGPILQLTGVPSDPMVPIKNLQEMKLTSIIVEVKKRNYIDPPLLIGTSIYVHLAMAKFVMQIPEEEGYRWRTEGNMLE